MKSLQFSWDFFGLLDMIYMEIWGLLVKHRSNSRSLWLNTASNPYQWPCKSSKVCELLFRGQFIFNILIPFNEHRLDPVLIFSHGHTYPAVAGWVDNSSINWDLLVSNIIIYSRSILDLFRKLFKEFCFSCEQQIISYFGDEKNYTPRLVMRPIQLTYTKNSFKTSLLDHPIFYIFAHWSPASVILFDNFVRSHRNPRIETHLLGDGLIEGGLWDHFACILL